MITDVLHAVASAGKIILPFLWKNSLYAGLIWLGILVITRVFRVGSPRWLTMLWLLVFLRLALPPQWAHPFTPWNLLGPLPIPERLVNWLDGDHPGRRAEIAAANESHSAVGEESEWPGSIARFLHPGTAEHDLLFAVPFLLWLSGAMILFSLYLKKIKTFRTIVNEASPVTDPEIAFAVTAWRDLFHVRQQVSVVSSSQFLTPFTAGVRKPVIYLPHLALETIEPIIAHEMAHIQRRDNLWMKLLSIIQIAYFFNPVVWYANSRVNLYRESMCDAMVLAKDKISPLRYGQGIMAILKSNLFSAEEIDVLPGFGSHRKKLMYRIHHLRGEKPMGKRQALFLYTIFILIGIFVLPMASAFVQSSKILPDATIAAGQSTAPVQEEKTAFIVPIQVGKLTAPYGKWINPFTKKEAFHNGVDVAAPTGTEVTAAASGTVTSAISDIGNETSGNGKYIIIQHENGYETFYSHLDDVLVDIGRHVSAGELIGRVGATGKSTGPHLHFEIRKDGKAQNPEDFVTFKSLKAIQ